MTARCTSGRGRGGEGFTLIELLITIAIVGLIAAIALPMYNSQMAKTRRADGKSALVEAANKQEGYFLDNKTYTTAMTNLGYSASPYTTDEGYYQVSVQAATVACPIATCFVLQAVPQGAQASDSCGTLTYSSTGAKGSSGGSDCW